MGYRIWGKSGQPLRWQAYEQLVTILTALSLMGPPNFPKSLQYHNRSSDANKCPETNIPFVQNPQDTTAYIFPTVCLTLN